MRSQSVHLQVPRLPPAGLARPAERVGPASPVEVGLPTELALPPLPVQRSAIEAVGPERFVREPALQLPGGQVDVVRGDPA